LQNTVTDFVLVEAVKMASSTELVGEIVFWKAGEFVI
jgi:hypothetical protein